MIFDEIVIHNFGSYLGRHALNLAPRSDSQTIVLIGGLNGAGKTTLLDAIQLALYGKQAHCSNRKALSYEEFLRRSINQFVLPSEGAAVELQFRTRTEGREHTYRVQRSWKLSDDQLREVLEVVCDGILDRVLSQNWSEHIGQLLPPAIANLFFFDGEQIEGLADIDSSRAVLQTAIDSLLGLEVLTQLGSDLSAVERRNRLKLKGEADRAVLDRLQAEIDELETRSQEAVNRSAQAQNALDRANKALRDIETQLAAQGGNLFRDRKMLEHEKLKLQFRLSQLDEENREIAAGVAPLLVCEDAIRAMAICGEEESKAERDQLVIQLLSERDRSLLRLARSHKVGKSALLALEGALSDDRKKRAANIGSRSYLRINSETLVRIQALKESVFVDLRERTEKLLGQTDDVRRELTDTDRLISRIPAEGSIASVVAREKECRLSVMTAETQLHVSETQLGAIRRETVAKRAKYVSLLESNAKEEFAREDTGRLLQYSEKARAIVAGFSLKLIKRNISNIEALVLESFKTLLRKETLVSALSIDPTTFRIELRNHSGHLIQADRLAAGERQLLALSLLWGLARASGRPIPVVIDTPLGRLDATHRAHLLERYFPYASHQTIVLSTDEEINERYFTKIQKWVGHAYRLEFNEAARSTEIKPGYFWEA